MSLVFNSSQDLICELFTHWFGPLETTLFDTALCNKELRVSLLDSFLSVLYHHKGCDELHQKNCAFNAWIVLRKIKIVALKLEKIDLLTKEFDVLLTDKLQDLSVDLCCGHRKFNRLELCTEENVLQYVSTKCSQLRCLEITFHTKGNELEVINFINCNNHLKTVQFYFDCSLGNNCLQAISSSCVNIEQVHIHHAASDVHLNNITAVLKTCKLLKFMTLVMLWVVCWLILVSKYKCCRQGQFSQTIIRLLMFKFANPQRLRDIIAVCFLASLQHINLENNASPTKD